MTQNEALNVGNAHSPRGGGHTTNPTSNIQGICCTFYNNKYVYFMFYDTKWF